MGIKKIEKTVVKVKINIVLVNGVKIKFNIE